MKNEQAAPIPALMMNTINGYGSGISARRGAPIANKWDIKF